MLFTDNPAIAIEDLADYETAILDTAQTEAINLRLRFVSPSMKWGCNWRVGLLR